MSEKQQGQIKAGRGTLIGNAGEYFVVAELLRQGIVAALAPRNNPGFDILATDGIKSVNIRVKTKTSAANSWVWMAKKDKSVFKDISENDFTVLVDIGDGSSPVVYFILSTLELDERLKHNYDVWVAEPGQGGKPHNPEARMRRLGADRGDSEWLEKYVNWSPILERLHVTEDQ